MNYSNRTFMELKCIYDETLLIKQKNSNRTFMELKYEGDTVLTPFMGTPIAPLWN